MDRMQEDADALRRKIQAIDNCVSFGSLWRISEELWKEAFFSAHIDYDFNSRRNEHPGVSIHFRKQQATSGIPILMGNSKRRHRYCVRIIDIYGDGETKDGHLYETWVGGLPPVLFPAIYFVQQKPNRFIIRSRKTMATEKERNELAKLRDFFILHPYGGSKKAKKQWRQKKNGVDWQS